jgi:sec-independent protein translocase protein TatC
MPAEQKTGSLYSHFAELRKVLIYSFLAVLAGTFVAYAFFMEPLMAIFLGPIKALDKQLVFISVGEGFITQLKVAVFAGTVMASPVILWQVIGFVAPALYEEEKRALDLLLVISTFLFASGVLLGYFLILGMGLRILLVTFSAGLTPMVSVSSYLSFVFWFLLPFGVIFEIPVIAYFLSRVGLISPQLLREKRKYVIFIMFVIAAVLTPPDVITQIFMAVPMLILYELSIWVSKWVVWKQKKKQVNTIEEPGL